MKDAGFRCARALVEVPRILVQKGWKYGAADHNVSKAVGVESAEPLSVSLCARAVVRCGPAWSNPATNPIPMKVTGSVSALRASENFSLVVSGGLVVINDIEIWHETQNPLLFLDLDLLDRDFGGGRIHSHRRSSSGNL